MLRRTRTFLLLGAAVLAVSSAGVGMANAAAPSGGTVSVAGGTVTFTAGSSVDNDVSGASTLDQYFGIKDAAAPIALDRSTVGRCTRNNAYSVRCTGITAIRVSLGDGNDKMYFEGYAGLTALGGAGNDTLDATYYDVPVRFLGGTGVDVLIGGSADDDLDAGTGGDRRRTQRTEGNAGLDHCAGSYLVKVSCER